ENIGIILLGIGLGVLGLATAMPTLAEIGFAAGLLHVLNHSIFKGLLFLAAGAVQHGARSLELEELGGLLKRMPWTGAAFLVGAGAPLIVPALVDVVAVTTGAASDGIRSQLVPIAASLTVAVSVFAVMTLLGIAGWWWRARRLAARGIGSGPVWGCGYLCATP